MTMLRCSLGVSLRRASALPAPSSTTMTSILSGPLYVSETYVLILLSQRSSVTRKTCGGEVVVVRVVATVAAARAVARAVAARVVAETAEARAVAERAEEARAVEAWWRRHLLEAGGALEQLELEREEVPVGDGEQDGGHLLGERVQVLAVAAARHDHRLHRHRCGRAGGSLVRESACVRDAGRESGGVIFKRTQMDTRLLGPTCLRRCLSLRHR